MNHTHELRASAGTGKSESAILSLRDLVVEFSSGRGLHTANPLRAVTGVNLDVYPGESLGVVGESGCGKTTLARAMTRLIDPSEGRIVFEGDDVTRKSGSSLRDFRTRVQIVFQDPHSSLDPRMRIGEIVSEPLFALGLGTRRERAARVGAVLELVGLSATSGTKYPNQFSGGQRQRIGIARALAPNPSVLVLDEPVSALDVSIQAQILNLLADLRERLHLTCIFISHDLGVVRQFCDRLAVMYLGEIVELGAADQVLEHPNHPFTQSLLDSLPSLRVAAVRRPSGSQEDPPSPVDRPAGCAFHPRCPVASARCRAESPRLQPPTSGSTRMVACFHPLGCG